MIPTRGRTALLAEAISSFLVTTHQHELMSLWIAVDDDDQETLDYAKGLDAAIFPFPIHWVVLPRQPALMLTWNLLWQAVSDGPGYYLGFVDDYEMTTPGWDDQLRTVLGDAPHGLGLGHIADATYPNSEAVTIICATAAWFNRLGYFVPPYFSFWFADSWHDQIATASGLKHQLPVAAGPQRGLLPGTLRMRDLHFWFRVYTALAPERMMAADSLAKAAYADCDVAWEKIGRLRESIVSYNRILAERLIEQPEGFEAMEKDFASPKPLSPEDLARYQAIKSAVIDYLGPDFQP